jgi:hypothetical protein
MMNVRVKPVEALKKGFAIARAALWREQLAMPQVEREHGMRRGFQL